MDIAFNYDTYVLKRQFLALTGILRIFNPQDQLALVCQQQILKLKEDIRIFSDETKSRELLNIRARQVIDFSAYYDVIDNQYSTRIGILHRLGFQSMVQDVWEVYDGNEILLGSLREDSLNKALLRRFLLGTLLPQNYSLNIMNEPVATYKQRFLLFGYTLDIDFQMDTGKILDHRLGLATAILLAMIERRQHRQA